MGAHEAANPRRTSLKISFVAYLISLAPDVAVGVGWLFAHEGWTLATVFMLQHLVAWAAVVTVLPRAIRRG